MNLFSSSDNNSCKQTVLQTESFSNFPGWTWDYRQIKGATIIKIMHDHPKFDMKEKHPSVSMLIANDSWRKFLLWIIVKNCSVAQSI